MYILHKACSNDVIIIIIIIIIIIFIITFIVHMCPYYHSSTITKVLNYILNMLIIKIMLFSISLVKFQTLIKSFLNFSSFSFPYFPFVLIQCILAYLGCFWTWTFQSAR